MKETWTAGTPRTKSTLARAPDLEDLVSMMTESGMKLGWHGNKHNVSHAGCSGSDSNKAAPSASASSQTQHQPPLPDLTGTLVDKENLGSPPGRRDKQQVLLKHHHAAGQAGSGAGNQGEAAARPSSRPNATSRQHVTVGKMRGTSSARQKPPAGRQPSVEGSRSMEDAGGPERKDGGSNGGKREEARGRMMLRHAELEERIHRLASSCERGRECDAMKESHSPDRSSAPPAPHSLPELPPPDAPIPLPAAPAASAPLPAPQPQAPPTPPRNTSLPHSPLKAATAPQANAVPPALPPPQHHRRPAVASGTQTDPDRALILARGDADRARGDAARALGDAERLEATVTDLVETYQIITERRKAATTRKAIGKVRMLRLRTLMGAWSEASARECLCDSLGGRHERYGRMRDVFFAGISRRAGVASEAFGAWANAVECAREDASERRRVVEERDLLLVEVGVTRGERDALSERLAEVELERDALSGVSGEMEALLKLASKLESRLEEEIGDAARRGDAFEELLHKVRLATFRTRRHGWYT